MIKALLTDLCTGNTEETTVTYKLTDGHAGLVIIFEGNHIYDIDTLSALLKREFGEHFVIYAGTLRYPRIGVNYVQLANIVHKAQNEQNF